MRGRPKTLAKARTRGVTLEGAQWDALEAAAKEWGISVSELMRRIVAAALEPDDSSRP